MSQDRGWSIPGEERVEVKAFLDLFRSAPPSFTGSAGLAYVALADGCLVSLPMAPAYGLNRILGVRKLSDLDVALEWFRGRGGNRYLQINELEASPDVLARIAERGLVRQGNGWVKLARSAPETSPAWNGNIDVRSASISDAPLFGRLMCEGFGLSPDLAPFWSSVVAKPGWHCVIASASGAAAGTAIMYADDGYAWLGGGTTLKQYRNRGVQSALIKARLGLGRTAGVHTFAVETARPEPNAGRTSFDNVVRAGFRELYTRQNFLLAD